MADPTAQNRKALVSGVRKVVPSSSPLGKSLEEDKLEEEEQLAVDEANNLVEQRAPVELPAEAQAFTSPVAPTGSRAPADLTGTQSFINPSAAPAASPAPAQAPSAPTGPVGPKLYDESGDVGKVLDSYEAQNKKLQSDADEIQKQKELAIQQQMDSDAKALPQIKPTEIFAGKATWQKILGGIGLFLGSITPEGAKNVANMIDKEIERDQQLQMNNIKLKLDKDDRHFKSLMQKYGSQEAALNAKKADAFGMVKLHIEKLGLASKNAHTRASLELAYKQAENEEARYRGAAFQAAMKAQKEEQKGSISGYAGTIQDPTAAREFRTQIAEMPGVLSEIKNLKTINEGFMGGSLSPEARASAQQSQTLLIGKLRVALIGPGTVNESEYKLLKDAISNPTDFFSLGSSNKLKLDKLELAYKNKIEANAAAYGLQKVMPAGARKI